MTTPDNPTENPEDETPEAAGAPETGADDAAAASPSGAAADAPADADGDGTAGGTEPEAEEAPEAAPDEDSGAEEPSPEDEVADLKDKLLRTLADMENLRRRSQKERQDALRYGAAGLALEILTVADNLRRALESAPTDDGAEDGALAGFIEGVQLTEKSLHAALERQGVQRIEPEGEKFDPQFHEAMLEMPAPGAAPGTVVQVLEVGYVIHERLLRPAKVAVARAAPEETPQE